MKAELNISGMIESRSTSGVREIPCGTSGVREVGIMRGFQTYPECT